MTFITSKDTIESLMGPAIRTQPKNYAISPRQQRMRVAGLRSQSESCLNDYPVSSLPGAASITYASGQQGDPLHPQNQFSNRQHMAQFPSPASLYSNTQQPRRRRSRQSLYSSSIDLGSRSSLAPVIETESTPTEEKELCLASLASRSSQESIHFSLPFSTKAANQSQLNNHGLGLILPETQTHGMCGGLSDDLAKAHDPFVVHDILRPHALTTQSTPDLRHTSDLELQADQAHETTSPYRESSQHILDSTRSTPELTCSSSFSSHEDDEAGPRSSISSLDSVKSFAASNESLDADDLLNLDAEAVYALHLRDLHRLPTHGQHITRQTSLDLVKSKSNKILGPESPTTGSFAQFSPSIQKSASMEQSQFVAAKSSQGRKAKSRWSFLRSG